MEYDLSYEAENFSVNFSAPEYIKDFRDPEKFIEFCKQCPSYGNRWNCPPFERDYSSEISRFKHILLTATRIYPKSKGLPFSVSGSLIMPERIKLERKFRHLEKETGGLIFLYAGSCLHCKNSCCTRSMGIPCRFPELARPSLEAIGFDIGKTLKELFGIDIKWGENGILPEYLTLVCGLFHNRIDKIENL